MKKILIGGLVGGIIIFIWQTLSWTMLRLHDPAQQYTPAQDSIVSYLSTHLKEGGYLLPREPPGATMDESNKIMQNMAGKPWAIVYYHNAFNLSMGKNIAQNLVANIFMAFLFCWVISYFKKPVFSSIFLSSVFVGIIVFINVPFTGHTWYPMFDITAHLLDALVSWAAAGLWFGFYLKEKKRV